MGEGFVLTRKEAMLEVQISELSRVDRTYADTRSVISDTDCPVDLGFSVGVGDIADMIKGGTFEGVRLSPNR